MYSTGAAQVSFKIVLFLIIVFRKKRVAFKTNMLMCDDGGT